MSNEQKQVYDCQVPRYDVIVDPGRDLAATIWIGPGGTVQFFESGRSEPILESVLDGSSGYLSIPGSLTANRAGEVLHMKAYRAGKLLSKADIFINYDCTKQ